MSKQSLVPEDSSLPNIKLTKEEKEEDISQAAKNHIREDLAHISEFVIDVLKEL